MVYMLSVMSIVLWLETHVRTYTHTRAGEPAAAPSSGAAPPSGSAGTAAEGGGHYIYIHVYRERVYVYICNHISIFHICLDVFKSQFCMQGKVDGELCFNFVTENFNFASKPDDSFEKNARLI